MDRHVELRARVVGGRDHQRVLGAPRVPPRDGRHALPSIRNLMDAPLRLQPRDGGGRLAPRELLDHLPELGRLLPDDGVQPHRPHPALPHLREHPAGLDRFMLPRVPHQQYPVGRMQAREERMHLPGRRERALIDHIQQPLARVRLPAARQMFL